jgi:hypothetical protein
MPICFKPTVQLGKGIINTILKVGTLRLKYDVPEYMLMVCIQILNIYTLFPVIQEIFQTLPGIVSNSMKTVLIVIFHDSQSKA